MINNSKDILQDPAKTFEFKYNGYEYLYNI